MAFEIDYSVVNQQFGGNVEEYLYYINQINEGLDRTQQLLEVIKGKKLQDSDKQNFFNEMAKTPKEAQEAFKQLETKLLQSDEQLKKLNTDLSYQVAWLKEFKEYSSSIAGAKSDINAFIQNKYLEGLNKAQSDVYGYGDLTDISKYNKLLSENQYDYAEQLLIQKQRLSQLTAGTKEYAEQLKDVAMYTQFWELERFQNNFNIEYNPAARQQQVQQDIDKKRDKIEQLKKSTDNLNKSEETRIQLEKQVNSDKQTSKNTRTDNERIAIDKKQKSLEREIQLHKELNQIQTSQTNQALNLAQNIPGFSGLQKNLDNIKTLFNDLYNVINKKSLGDAIKKQMQYPNEQIEQLKNRISELKNGVSSTQNSTFKTEMDEWADQLARVSGEGAALNQQIGNLGQQTSGAGQQISGLVGKLQIALAVILSVVTAVKAAIDQFNKLANACIKLINNVKNVGKQFVNTLSSITGFQAALNKLQSVFKSFVQFVNTRFNFYQLKSYFTEGIELAGEMSRSLANVKAQFEEYGDTIEAFAKSAPTQLGVSTADVLKQANAFGGIFRGWGLSAEESTSLFMDLQKVAAAAMYKTGDSFEYFMDKFNSYTAGPRAVSTELNERGLGWAATTDDLRAFQKALGMNFDDMNDTQRKYVELVYIIKQQQPLLNNLDNYTSSMAFRAKMFAAQLEGLKAQFGTLASQIRYLVIPTLMTFINILQRLVDYINEIIKKAFNLPQLSIETQDAVQSMEDVSDAIDEVTSQLGSLDEVDVLQSGTATTIPGLTGGLYNNPFETGSQQNSKPDFSFLDTYIDEIKSFMAAMEILWGDTGEKVSEWFNRNMDNFESIFGNILHIAMNVFNIIQTGINKYVTIANKVGGVWDRIVKNIETALDGLNIILATNADKLQSIVSNILLVFTHLYEVGTLTLSKIFGNADMQAVFKNTIDSIDNALQQINSWFETGGTDALQTALQDVAKILVTIVGLVGEVISDLFGGGEYEGSPMQKLISKIQEIITEVLEFLQSPYGKAFIETIVDVLLLKVELMIKRFEFIFAIVKDIQGMIYTFKTALEDTGNVIGALSTLTVYRFGQSFGIVFNLLKNLFQSIADYISQKFDSFKNTVYDLIFDLPNAVRRVIDNIGEIFSSIINYFTQLTGQLFSGFNEKFFGGVFGSRQTGTSSKTYQFTPFANGGIVSGKTAAIVGEYANVKSNPEVIAPLDRLQSLIGGQSDDLIYKIINKLDDLDQRLYNIQNKNNDVYLDGQVISRTVINNINNTTITNGRSPLMT